MQFKRLFNGGLLVGRQAGRQAGRQTLAGRQGSAKINRHKVQMNTQESVSKGTRKTSRE